MCPLLFYHLHYQNICLVGIQVSKWIESVDDGGVGISCLGFQRSLEHMSLSRDSLDLFVIVLKVEPLIYAPI